MASLFDSWSRGVEQGRENKRQRVLGQNMQSALGGDQSALSSVFGVDPGAGMQVQQFAAQQKQAQQQAKALRAEEFGKVAAAFASTKNPQLYGQFVAMGTELGLIPQGAPQQPTSPEDIEESAQAAMAFAQAYGGVKPMETPSAIRELQMLQADPKLRALDMERRQAGFNKPQLIQTDQGYAWATPEGATPLNYGQGGGVDQSQVQRALAMLAGQPGVQMTSGLRTPERNAAVGGRPNSQHLRGTAGDYAVPQAQKAAFMAQARQMGLEAIDEGDHVHLEVPGQQGQRVMPAPKSSAKTELEKRLELAQQMNATPEELKRMVVGGDNARDAQRISTADATKARQKLIQIQTARRQLDSAKQAFSKLKDSYSAGPGGNLIPTQEGQAFDRAVRNLAPLITAVTRVPGVGAMSDFESKLQEASLPSRGTFEGTTVQQIADLEAMLDTIEGGYRDLLGEKTQAQPKEQGGDVDSLLAKYGVR